MQETACSDEQHPRRPSNALARPCGDAPSARNDDSAGACVAEEAQQPQHSAVDRARRALRRCGAPRARRSSAVCERVGRRGRRRRGPPPPRRRRLRHVGGAVAVKRRRVLRRLGVARRLGGDVARRKANHGSLGVLASGAPRTRCARARPMAPGRLATLRVSWARNRSTEGARLSRATCNSRPVLPPHSGPAPGTARARTANAGTPAL